MKSEAIATIEGIKESAAERREHKHGGMCGGGIEVHRRIHRGGWCPYCRVCKSISPPLRRRMSLDE